jgi:hypothetical protein
VLQPGKPLIGPFLIGVGPGVERQVQLDLGVLPEIFKDGIRDGGTGPVEVTQTRHLRDEMSKLLPDLELRVQGVSFVPRLRVFQVLFNAVRDVDVQRTDGGQEALLVNREQARRRIVLSHVDG